MSRAAWLVAGTAAASLGGSVTLAGCAGDDTDGPTASAGTAGNAASASVDAGLPLFACGWTPGDAGHTGLSCNPATEFCLMVESFTGCDEYDSPIVQVSYACSAFASANSSKYFPVARCGEQPRCSCTGFASTPVYLGIECGEDDGGGITVTDTSGSEGFCGCYGCPPARLERLSAA